MDRLRLLEIARNTAIEFVRMNAVLSDYQFADLHADGKTDDECAGMLARQFLQDALDDMSKPVEEDEANLLRSTGLQS